MLQFSFTLPYKCLKTVFNSVIWHVKRTPIHVAITFDVERDWQLGKYAIIPAFKMINRSLPKFVKIAEIYGVRYTFFVTGEVAESCKDLLLKILKRKHEIGTHTSVFSPGNI